MFNYTKACLCFKQRQYEACVRVASVALRETPGDTIFLYERARAYFEMNNLQNALADLTEGIQCGGGASFYHLRSLVLQKLARPEDAEHDLAQSRRLESTR